VSVRPRKHGHIVPDARAAVLTSPCQVWDGSLNQAGYGVLPSQKLAHRAAWEDAGNEIPAGWHIHHICGNRACVNPAHLECLSPSEHSRLHAPPAPRTLTDLREGKRMSLEQLAQVTGVGKAILSQIEHGRINPTNAELRAIEAGLDLPARSLELRILLVFEAGE
jgi:hypothetical protein